MCVSMFVSLIDMLLGCVIDRCVVGVSCLHYTCCWMCCRCVVHVSLMDVWLVCHVCVIDGCVVEVCCVCVIGGCVSGVSCLCH